MISFLFSLLAVAIGFAVSLLVNIFFLDNEIEIYKQTFPNAGCIILIVWWIITLSIMIGTTALLVELGELIWKAIIE